MNEEEKGRSHKKLQVFYVKIINTLNKLLFWGGRYIDYFLFIIIFMYKVMLFEKYTKASFATKGFIEYLKQGFYSLVFKGDITPLYEGIFMVSLGSILLLSFWVLFLQPFTRLISLIVLNFFVTLILLSDLIYFRYFKDFISVSTLLQLNQLRPLGSSIRNLFQLRDVLFIIDLIILIPFGVYFILKNKQKKFLHNSLLSRIGMGIVMFSIGYILTMAPVKAVAVNGWGKSLLEVNWWNVSIYNVTGLIGFHGYDIYNYLKDNVLKQKEIPEERIREIKEWFFNREKSLNTKNPFYGIAKGKNVIIIQVEALQNFVIGRKINGEEVTPNLNNLLKNSMYFKNFYHQTAQGGTSDAEFLTLCSLYPLPSGSVYIRYGRHEYDTLLKVLKTEGYKTAAFHAYESSYWNRYNIYNNIGFDKFFSKNDFVLEEQIGWGLSDEAFFRQSVEKIKEINQPFCVFLVTLSSHHPYEIPEKYKRLNIGSLEGTNFGNYIHSIHYVDYSIGKMINLLKEKGLWDETVFVVYGDHDSKIEDNRALTSFLGKEPTALELERIRYQVPLIIHLPRDQGAGTYEQPGGQIDITPTLLHLLGIPENQKYFMGNNMLSNTSDRLVVFRNGCFTDGKIFYVFSSDQVYEHGRCYEISFNKEQQKFDEYRSLYERAQQQLRISDDVIMGNLIKRFKEQ